MRRIVKFLACAVVLSAFVLASQLLAIFLKGAALRRQRIRLTAFVSRQLLQLFGVHVTYRAPEGIPKRPVLLIANHVSYLDVLVLCSKMESVFVTSVEVHDSAILGTLCRKGGSRFVERRSRSFLVDEIETIRQYFSDGFTVCVFPEGTTTDGSGLLPFRRSLLEAAAKAGVPVLPACINYKSIDGKPVDSTNRDLLFYYGDAEFLPHLKGLLGTRSIEVEVHFLHAVSSHDTHRKDVAEKARTAIENHFLEIL